MRDTGRTSADLGCVEHLLKDVVIGHLSSTRSLDFGWPPLQMERRDLFGPKVEGISKRFMEYLENVSSVHENLDKML